MRLHELVEESDIDPEYARVCLGLIKEVDCMKFVGMLCQVAYEIGFQDALDEDDE
jgi:hypothetical protein